MAHQSGYGGSIAVTQASSDVDCLENDLEDWTVEQSTQGAEAYAKGEEYATTFATVSEWSATAVVLLQTDETDDTLKAEGQEYTFTFKVNANDNLAGTGIVTGMAPVSPLDGPARLTVQITGTGALVHTAA